MVNSEQIWEWQWCFSAGYILRIPCLVPTRRWHQTLHLFLRFNVLSVSTLQCLHISWCGLLVTRELISPCPSRVVRRDKVCETIILFLSIPLFIHNLLLPILPYKHESIYCFVSLPEKFRFRNWMILAQLDRFLSSRSVRSTGGAPSKTMWSLERIHLFVLSYFLALYLTHTFALSLSLSFFLSRSPIHISCSPYLSYALGAYTRMLSLTSLFLFDWRLRGETRSRTRGSSVFEVSNRA